MTYCPFTQPSNPTEQQQSPAGPWKFKQWHIAQGCPLTNHRSLLLHTQQRRGNQSAAQEGASALRRALCIHINAPPLAVF